ncbi:type II toxin-antitoxin system HicB family antitoxin [Moorella sp. Hama-1]|uniref:type II toxin-antitoxin system HicB family antitoxin n=1 Tax=Moorella sp. Hama-1 TaxID=2138101 RepID=UPI000D646964|nr:hypothetical protein [Moorella sp. Hama-1]BCV21969.1 hypothetical protein hamaS1_20380 [Moorella sp. Hama-1]
MASMGKIQTSGLKFTGKFTPCKEGYLGECLEIDAVVEGKTLEEARKLLQEAVKFHIEVFGLEEFIQSQKAVYETFEVSNG